MSFGVEQSQKVSEGGTLGGLIASKAMQSRKDAVTERQRQKEAEEKGGEVNEEDKRGLLRKALLHNFGGGSLSGKKSFGEHFNYKVPPKPKSADSSSAPSSSGGTGSGLAKILTGGFGSLVSDTQGIQGGLTAITQLLNSQLQSSSFTATGISGIQSILADQLEAQEQFIDLMGGERSTGGGGGGGDSKSNMFGMTGSVAAAGGTLSEAAINAALEKGIGRFLLSRLSKLNPFQKKPQVPGGPPKPPKGYNDAFIARKNAERLAAQQPKIKPKGFGQQLQDIGSGMKGKASQAMDYGKGLLGKAKGAGSNIIQGITSSPIAKKMGMAGARFGGRMLPVAGTGFSAAEAVDRGRKGDVVGAWLAGLGGAAGAATALTAPAAATGPGAIIPAATEATSMVADIGLLGYDLVRAFNPASKMSSGGVMLGEAGKEAVVDLNSSGAKQIKGNEDPGMKASGASMLAVVDQFVKGMGPLGSPVTQALGPDVQNLSRQFGMSQVLPNLNIGGGKFKEDGNAKKQKNDFLESLISGSLEALGAKKKDDKKPEKLPTPPPNPGPVGDPNSPANPAAAPATPTPTGSGADRPMDDHRSPTATTSGFTPNLTGTSFNPMVGAGGKPKSNNRIHLEVPGFNGKYEVLSNRADGKFEVWEKGLWGIIGNKPKLVGTGKDNTTGKYKDPLFAASYNEVRANYRNKAVETGVRFGYITTDEYKAKKKETNDAKVNGDQQRGGIVKESYQKGGQKVEKPWWDFLGLVTGAKEVQKGTTGIYSNSPMGKIGEAAAQRNKMMKDMGYEKGGSLFGMTNSKSDVNKVTIEQRMDGMEEVLVTMTKVLALLSSGDQQNTVNVGKTTASPPKTSPSAPPIAATNQVADEMSGAAIINVIGGGGSSPVISSSSGSTQNTADYAGDPSCNGLAAVLCTSSPWGSS